MTMRANVLLSLLLILGLGACERSKAAPAADVARPARVGNPQPAAKVARIVFLDKEHACACTRRTVEQTWAALKSALGASPSLPVQRLHLDTQTAEAAAYTTTKPLMALPGIYFVDGQGAVLDLLQGEVAAKEIEARLKGR
jgi:hypothetical protein